MLPYYVCVLLFLAGICFGLSASWFIRTKKDGEFQIDSKNPEKDLCRIVLYEEVDDIKKEKYIVLKVLNDTDLPMLP